MKPGVTKASVDESYSLTMYLSNFDPTPIGSFDEFGSLSWQGVIEQLAPSDSPRLLRNKSLLLYFTPGLLVEAELSEYAVRNYKKRFGVEVLIGRSRSKACCQGPSNLLVFDIDGVRQEEFESMNRVLAQFGCNYLIYSTFSFGSLEKPGHRFRLVIPLSDAVKADQYTLVHTAISSDLIADVRHGIDQSSKTLTQQQGVWATRPELATSSFKYQRCDGGVLDTAYWLDKGAQSNKAQKQANSMHNAVTQMRAPSSDTALAIELELALQCIPSRTSYFQTLLMALKAISPSVDGYGLFYSWLWSDPEHQAEQEASRDAYKPDLAWARAKPLMPGAAGVGVIHKLAKECAVLAIESDLTLLNGQTKTSARYLRIYQQSTFLKLRAQFEVQRRLEPISNVWGVKA